MKCQKCSAEIEKGDLYCPECGEKVVKEARTITVWSIFKVLLVLISLIIMAHIFKNAPGAPRIVILILTLLFILWSGILNWFLKKLFNIKISTGVKIAITIVVLLILFFGAKMATRTSTPTVNRIIERPPTGEDEVYMYNTVEEINHAFNYKNAGELKPMVEKGVITTEVFEDLKNLLIQSGRFTITLNPKNNRLSETHAEMDTEVLLKSSYDERRQGVVLVFEKRGSAWTLIKITPRLTDIKIAEPFEEAVSVKEQSIVQLIT